MIVKKVQYQDITDRQLYLMARERNPSPRVMLTAKKQVQSNIEKAIDTDASFGECGHFDDREYFSTQNRLMQSREEGRGVLASRARHRCANKIISSGERISHQNTPSPIISQRAQDLFMQFLNQDTTPFPTPVDYKPNNTDDRRRNYSSLSVRRKFSSITSVHCVQKEQELQRGKMERMQGRKSQRGFCLKTSKENRSCCEINPYTKQEYLHQRVAQRRSKESNKKFNSLDYSIIKPNEIRPVSLSLRDGHSVLPKKCKDKWKYEQIIAVMRQREQNLRQHMKSQLQKQRRHRQRRQPQPQPQSQPQPRSKPSSLPRPFPAVPCPQQKNQVQPWQVQWHSNLIDII